MKRKGYYIKKQSKQEIILNIYTPDFIEYLSSLNHVNGWLRFKIYERDKPAVNGLTHNMELIVMHNKED